MSTYPPLNAAELPAATISHVERETGLSKDTLRKWERRYGFPNPARDTNDERLYPADQIERLRAIRRLMDCGERPGKIVALALPELIDRQRKVSASTAGADEEPDSSRAGLLLLKSHERGALRQWLMQQLLELGLRRFILEIIAHFNVLVGKAWIDGGIEVFEEHLYTEQVQQLLQAALSSMPPVTQAPRVLLATLPGEEHRLGLLMAQAFLGLEGAECLSLGSQTPVVDIVKAARAHHADIVGLSCGSTLQWRDAISQLTDLRALLESRVALWAGGAAWAKAPAGIEGITTFTSLVQIPPAIAEWRAKRTR